MATYNYVKSGKTVSVIAASGATKWVPLKLGALFGVPLATVSAGEEAEVMVGGVWDLPKEAALACSVGDRIYWDSGAGECDKTDTNDLIGVCVKAAAGADTTVRVRLDDGGIKVDPGDVTAVKNKTDTITLASAAGAGSIYFSEDTDNGVNKVTVIAPGAVTADRTVTLPDADLDLATVVTHLADDGSEHALVAAMDDLYVEPSIVSVGPAHTSAVAVAFKAIDAAGADEARAVPFTWWLSSSATTGAIHGTAPDGGVAWSPGLAIKEHTTSLFGYAVTDVNGDATITVTHAADAQDYYLWVEMGGHTVTSTKIEITA